MTTAMETYQDQFLHELKQDRVMATFFLMNGYQMRGIVAGYDSFVVLLLTDGQAGDDLQACHLHDHSLSHIEVPAGLSRCAMPWGASGVQSMKRKYTFHKNHLCRFTGGAAGLYHPGRVFRDEDLHHHRNGIGLRSRGRV